MHPSKLPHYEVTPIRDLKDMFQQSTQKYAHRTAFLTKPHKGKPYVPVTYRQYGADINALGTALLKNLGLTQGTATAILGESQYEWYVSYPAVVAGASVVVPLDKELPANELASLICRSHVKAIIVNPTLRQKLEEALQMIEKDAIEGHALEHIVSMGKDFVCTGVTKAYQYHNFTNLIADGNELLAQGERCFLDYQIDLEEMRILLFTSGTTAKSKAVMLNHKAVITNLMAMRKMVNIQENDIFFSVLPLHHTYECTCGFLCPIYAGSCIAQCEGLRYIPGNLQECKATVMLVVPLIAEAFYKKIDKAIHADAKIERKIRFALSLTDFLRRIGIDKRRTFFKKIIDQFGGSLRMLIIGGAYLKPEILTAFNNFGLLTIQGYGLTECAPIIALNHDQYHCCASAGQPLPGVEIKVHHPGEDGIGEFIAKGDNIMLGYYENPEATAEVIDENGYFHTGDLGYMDKEQFLFITGRKKNVIITENGKNIYPEELELILGASPLVNEVIVSAKPGDKGDTLQLRADFFPNAEAIKEHFGREMSLDHPDVLKLFEEYVQKVNQGLSSYKTIRQVGVRTTEFEKNTSKKIKRHL